MKIGIFGGSFNPPHNMHQNIALNLIKLALLDRVIFVPTGDRYGKKELVDQTTPNMIQGLKGIFARKPLISRGIYSFLNFIRFREGCFLCLNLMKEKNEAL